MMKTITILPYAMIPPTLEPGSTAARPKLFRFRPRIRIQSQPAGGKDYRLALCRGRGLNLNFPMSVSMYIHIMLGWIPLVDPQLTEYLPSLMTALTSPWKVLPPSVHAAIRILNVATLWQ